MRKAKYLLLLTTDYLFIPVPDEHKTEFAIEVLHDNFAKLSIISVVMFFIEFILYFLQQAFFQTGYVIAIFLFSNLALIPLIWVVRARLRESTLPLAYIVQYGYAISVLALGLMLALVTQSRYDLIHMYLMAVIGVTVFINIKPIRCTIMLGAVYVAFWLLLPLYQTDTEMVLTDRVNALIFNILALFINNVMIRTKYTAYLGRRALKEKNVMLEELARKDSMTGLLYHDESISALSAEMQRSDRYSAPLSLMLIDIDNFKQINDRFGHLCGDEVIRKASIAIRNAARDTDIVGRYGGDEILMILPGVPMCGASALATRLSSAV